MRSVFADLSFKRPPSKFAGWLARHAAWVLLPAAPLMLFPRGMTPWLGLGLLLAALVLRAARGMRVAPPAALLPPLALLGAMAVLGYRISLDPGVSYARFWSIVFGLAAFIVLAAASGLPGRAWAWIQVLCLLGLGVAGLLILGGDWGTPRLYDPWGWYDAIPTLIRGLPWSGVPRSNELINIRWPAIILGCLAPAPFAYALWGSRRRFRWLYALIFFFTAFIVLLAQSLPGLLALTVGVFVLLVWRSPRWWLLVPLGALLAGLSVWIAGPGRLAGILLSMENPIGLGVVLRLDMWAQAWAMLSDMPLTGIGLNTFPLVQSQFYTGYIIGPEAHAHQFYLQTALDLGLPGLAAWIWLLLAWTYRLRLNYRLARGTDESDYRLLLAVAAAGVAGFVVHGFIDAQMLGSKPGAALWILLGLGASAYPGSDRQSRTVTGEWLLALAAGLTILIGVAGFWLCPGLLQRNLSILTLQRALYRPDLYSGFEFESGGGQASRAEISAGLEGLERSLLTEPDSAFAWEMVARAQAELGEYPSALEAYTRRIQLDARGDPWERYYPPASLNRRLEGLEYPQEQIWDDLLSLYARWGKRYPQLAENSVRQALIQDRFLGDRAAARRILHAALDARARPPGLIEYYLLELNR